MTTASYAINQQPVPKDQLDTQLHAIYDARPAKLLFLKPGQKRIYQDVIAGHGRGQGGRDPDHRVHAEGSVPLEREGVEDVK